MTVSVVFGSADGTGVHISMAYTHDLEAAEEFKKEVQEAFPNHEIVLNPLSLSIACHIGPGALAVTATKQSRWMHNGRLREVKADQKYGIYQTYRNQNC